MKILIAILFCLLLWDAALTVSMIREKKRTKEKINAILDHSAKVLLHDQRIEENFEKRLRSSQDETEAMKAGLEKRIAEAAQDINKNLEKRIEDLMMDYTQAKEAAKKVNDFASDLMNIFSYDPLAAAKSRNMEDE